MTDLFLMFAMSLDADSNLNRGRLMLLDRQRGVIGRWVATSGLGSYQDVGDWNHIGGGVIPAPYQLLKPVPWYKVAIEPTDLRAVKGVQGNAYAITPFELETNKGVTRSDVMIHNDANVPGSMGCIVLEGDGTEFDEFELVYSRECLKLPKGSLTVDLGVIYTY
jgi:hypothetical protein